MRRSTAKTVHWDTSTSINLLQAAEALCARTSRQEPRQIDEAV